MKIFIVILNLLYIALNVESQSPGCPSGFSVSKDGRFCWKFDPTPKTQYTANTDCMNSGTPLFEPQHKGLADIHSAEQNKELADFIKEKLPLDMEVWLGGTDLTADFTLWQWDASESCPLCNDAVHGIMQGQGCYNFSAVNADKRLSPLDSYQTINPSRDEEFPSRCIAACRNATGPRGPYDVAALRREDPDESLRYKNFYESSYPQRDPLTIPRVNRPPDGRSVRGTLCMCGYTSDNYARHGVSNSMHTSDLYACNQNCGASSRRHCGGLEANYIYRIGASTMHSDWADGQPNAARFYQNCALSLGSKEFKFGDDNCFKNSDTLAAVCRVDKSLCSDSARSSRTGTQEAYSYFRVLNDCAYVISNVSINWYEARYFCREMGGDLITLETASKFSAFQLGMGQYVTFDEVNRDFLDYWVGGNAGIWVWRERATNQIDYSNFQPAKNPGDYAFGRNCMVMLISHANNLNYWQARECDELKPSICQIDRGVQPTDSPTTIPPSTVAATTVSPSSSTPVKTKSVLLSTVPDSSSDNNTTPKSNNGDTTSNGTGGEPGAGASTGDESSSGLSTIEIILIILLIILVIGIIIIVILLCYYKRKNKKRVGSTYDARGDAAYPDDEKIYIENSVTGSQRWSTDC